MRETGITRHHAVLIIAFAAVAVASFEAGLLWRSKKQPELPTAPAVGRKSADVPGGSPDRSALVRASIRAEFNPQSALLIGANELVRYHQAVFKDLMRAVHGRIPVVGFVNDNDEAELGQSLLDEAGLPIDSVHFVKHQLDSMWLRDFGPLFTRWSDGEVSIVHPAYDIPDPDQKRPRDDSLATYVGQILHLKVERMPLVLEGGNLLSNGDGIMVTSTRVIERPENRHYSLMEIGQLLQNLGCRAWLSSGHLKGS